MLNLISLALVNIILTRTAASRSCCYNYRTLGNALILNAHPLTASEVTIGTSAITFDKQVRISHYPPHFRPVSHANIKDTSNTYLSSSHNINEESFLYSSTDDINLVSAVILNNVECDYRTQCSMPILILPKLKKHTSDRLIIIIVVSTASALLLILAGWRFRHHQVLARKSKNQDTIDIPWCDGQDGLRKYNATPPSDGPDDDSTSPQKLLSFPKNDQAFTKLAKPPAQQNVPSVRCPVQMLNPQRTPLQVQRSLPCSTHSTSPHMIHGPAIQPLQAMQSLQCPPQYLANGYGPILVPMQAMNAYYTQTLPYAGMGVTRTTSLISPNMQILPPSVVRANTYRESQTPGSVYWVNQG